ncbi:MAG: DNA-binding protein [Campylobacterales bacterium]|nr:DNA-binding protein [Campylobacterales bacterium]
MKMSVNDAAEFFGVSKEAIHNRVRRGSLEVVVEDGVKMVLVDEKSKVATPLKTNRTTTRVKSSIDNQRYYKLLEEQNAKLQARVETLEGETRTLRDQKEQMLIAEREKLEAIYKEKDEQLKAVLNTLSKQFMLSMPQGEFKEEDEETVDVEISEPQPAKEEAPKVKILSLKKFLKTLDITEKKRKKIKERFEEKAKKDSRIITLGDKIYVDLIKYDYSDLVKK